MTHHIVNLFDMAMQRSDCWEQIEACNSKTCRHLFSHTMHYKDKQPSFNFVHNTLFEHLPWHKQYTDKQISMYATIKYMLFNSSHINLIVIELYCITGASINGYLDIS